MELSEIEENATDHKVMKRIWKMVKEEKQNPVESTVTH